MSAPVVDLQAEDLAVYAIRFAHRERSHRREHFYRAHDCADQAMPIDYFVWLVAGRDQAVLVDAGFTPQVAARRGDREYLGSPIDTIARLGVPASRISHLVLTHLHYDHTGFASALPAAKLWLQRREWDYWDSPRSLRGENPHLIELADHVALQSAVERDGLIDGDVEILPGIRARRVGGHTAGLQVVEVDTAAGPLVLASDATHFYDNIADDRPYSIVDHLPSMYEAFDQILATAGSLDRVVPGHDPLVLSRFPAVEGFEGLAVRLA